VKFIHEIVIEKGREEVWRLFDDPDNMKHWQPTLQSFTPVSGDPGQPGAVSKLLYVENGRNIELVETILSRTHPEEFTGTYANPMVLNTIRNTFVAIGPNQTRWVMEGEFEFKGLLKLFGWTMRGALRRRVGEDCERFKRFAERANEQ